MRNVLCIIFLLMFVSCHSIEHKANIPNKKFLEKKENPSFKIQEKWNTYIGSRTYTHNIKLLLAIKNNYLYIADAVGTVKAFNIDTGKEIWCKVLSVPISSGPVIGSNKIIVCTYNGKIIALDMNGNFKWITSNTTHEILSTPKITNDMVLINDMHGSLSSFSIIDGREFWIFYYVVPSIILRCSSTPFIVDDKIYVGLSNSKILSIRKHDGSVNWSYEINSQVKQHMKNICSDPVVINNIVYVIGCNGNLVAINKDSGNMIWKRNLKSCSDLTIVDNVLYLSDSMGNIYAININSGKTYWKQIELEGINLSKPIITLNKYVIVFDNDNGNMHLLNRYSGIYLGFYVVDPKGIGSAPVIHNNIIYILGKSGKLASLEVY